MRSLDISSLLNAWLRAVASPPNRRLLGLVFVVDASLAFLFFIALQTYFPVDRLLGMSVAGLTLASFGTGKLGTQYVAGLVSDRFGPRNAAIAALLLILASLVLMIVAQHMSLLVIPAAAVYGVGSALVWPALYSFASRMPPSERAFVASAITFTTAVGVGSALGLGLLLPENLQFGIALVVCIAAIAVGLVLASGLSMKSRANDAIEVRSPIVPTTNDSSLFRLGAVFLLQSAAIAALLSLFRAIGRDVFEVTLREETLILAPAAAAFGCGVAGAGLLGCALPKGVLLPTAFALAALGFFSLISLDGIPAGLLSLSIACLGLGLALPTTVASSLHAAQGMPGGVFGSLLMVEGIGHALGPVAAAICPSTNAALAMVCGLLAAAAVFAVAFAASDRYASTEMQRDLKSASGEVS